MAYKLKICANYILAADYISNHNIEHYYIGPYEHSKKVAIIWDDDTNNSSNLKGEPMTSKLLAVYVNRDDAAKFIADNCIESGDRLPTDYTIVKRRNTGEYAVYYNFDEKHDNVNHPAHYTSGGIECIDGMVAAFGREYVMHYCLCNAFKYIWRCEHKGKRVEDIQKAVWYLNKWQSLAEEEVLADE